jgi:Raf kinase inhibitor-like YbhB/YbcL family protein
MSYAMVLIDNDNGANGFLHWVMWDIPASVTMLPADLPTGMMPSMPAGAKQRSFQADNGYVGPCPSGMDHEYTFTVYALDTATLEGMTDTTTNVVAAIEAADPLAEASLSGHSDAEMP